MKQTVKGLAEHQFQSKENANLQSKIDSSSHKIALVCRKTDHSQEYLRKAYASPAYAQKSGSQRSSYLSSIFSYLTPMFKNSPLEDPLEENKQLEFSGQLESFYSALYRILLCDRAAQTYALYNDNGSCVGTVSKIIPNFISAKKQKIIIQNHIEDLAKMIVASYLFEEDDLHKGNYGIASLNGLERIVRLDFDMSGWSRTYHVKGQRAASCGGILFSSPRDRFQLDEEDIRNLPVLHKASPFYWPTSLFYYFDDAQDFANLKDDLAFNRHKYLTFLQFCLIPNEYIRTLGRYYIEDKYTIDRNTHVEAIISRKNELLQMLLKMPAFYCMLFNDGSFKKQGFSAWNEINKAFTEYNTFIRTTDNFQKDELIPIDIVKQLFESIEKDVSSRFANIQEIQKTFKYKNFEPFQIPESERIRYRARKTNVQRLLRDRLDYLIKVNDFCKRSESIVYGPIVKAQNFYDRYVRNKDIKQLKIDWLTEVLENSKDEKKVIMEWFQTKSTPFYPIIQTGETGRLIEAIKKSENEYAAKLIQMHGKTENHLLNVSEISEEVKLNDHFADFVIDDSTLEEIDTHFKRVKAILLHKVNEQIEDYSKASYTSLYDKWSGKGNVRSAKRDYWNRVKGEVQSAVNFKSLFQAFDFTYNEKNHESEILDGSKTVALIKQVENIRSFTPTVPTERNHALIWIKALLKEGKYTHINQGFFGGSVKNPTYALEQTLQNLQRTDASKQSVYNCFAPLLADNLKDSCAEIRDILDIFRSTVPAAQPTAYTPFFPASNTSPFGSTQSNTSSMFAPQSQSTTFQNSSQLTFK